jgi:hypothetical protein
MVDQTADEIIKRLAGMATCRSEFETTWKQVADVAASDAPEFRFNSFGGAEALGLMRANAARRSKNIYDSTAAWAVDRLASGLEGLIMPQSETWHTLQVNDLFAIDHEQTDEEVEWLESLRNFLFRVRYDAASGWQTAIQVALRRMVAFGNSLMLVEEGDGRSLINYRHLPLSECYIAEDHMGRVDTVFRLYSLTARQAVQKFGERCSPEIQNAAKNNQDKDRLFQFVHAIYPRSDFGSPDEGVLRAPWASTHVEFATKIVVGESGYFEFPIIDFRWMPEPGRVYGEGPVMRVLADIQSLNIMSKTELVAAQQQIRPPLLVRRNGVINRPNTNPGATIVGGVDEQGRPAVQPLNLQSNISLAQAVIQAKRDNLRESLYINLFALMVQTPRMSATESLIRANEKGELLGPAGSRIQQSLSRLVERELGILSRRGVFARGSAFQPPRSLQGRSVGPKFTSPLDRLRRSKDAEGAIRTMEIIAPIAQSDPTIFDHFDKDALTRGVADVLGMPRAWLLRSEEVAEMREAREQAQAQQQQLLMAQQAAAAAKDAAPALATLTEMQGPIAA